MSAATAAEDTTGWARELREQRELDADVLDDPWSRAGRHDGSAAGTNAASEETA